MIIRSRSKIINIINRLMINRLITKKIRYRITFIKNEEIIKTRFIILLEYILIRIRFCSTYRQAASQHHHQGKEQRSYPLK